MARQLRGDSGRRPQSLRKTTWRYVASQLADAASGVIDMAHVAVAVRLVLMLEGVECRPRGRPADPVISTRQNDATV